jgi:hypothetical protein
VVLLPTPLNAIQGEAGSYKPGVAAKWWHMDLAALAIPGVLPGFPIKGFIRTCP